MTHKNIVRYYQAWVEGGGRDQAVIEEEDDDHHEDFVEDRDVLASENAQSDGDDEDTEGWWTNSPQERELAKGASQNRSWDSDSDDNDSSTSWSDTNDAPTANNGNTDYGTRPPANKSKVEKYRRTPSSLSEILENETNPIFGVSFFSRMNLSRHQTVVSWCSQIEPTAFWICFR